MTILHGGGGGEGGGGGGGEGGGRGGASKESTRPNLRLGVHETLLYSRV